MAAKSTSAPKAKEEKVKEKLKIVVVDDHPIVRQGLAQIINQEEDMALAGEAGDATEAMKVIKQVNPDMAIIDVSLTGTSGIELTKNILIHYPKMPILIVSMYDESLYVERVLKAGAKGYLMKQEATDNIVAAIRKILGGDIYVSEKMRDTLVHKLIAGGVPSGSSSENLSDRELEVLQLLGQGFSTRQIAEELHVSVKTVESHYANMKNKLNLKSAHELIQYAIKWTLAEKS